MKNYTRFRKRGKTYTGQMKENCLEQEFVKYEILLIFILEVLRDF